MKLKLIIFCVCVSAFFAISGSASDNSGASLQFERLKQILDKSGIAKRLDSHRYIAAIGMNHYHFNWGIIIQNDNDYEVFYGTEGSGFQTVDSVVVYDMIPIIEWAFSLQGEPPAHYIRSESDTDAFSVYSYYFIGLDDNKVLELSEGNKYTDQEFENKLLSVKRMFVRITCPELRDLIPDTDTTHTTAGIK